MSIGEEVLNGASQAGDKIFGSSGGDDGGSGGGSGGSGGGSGPLFGNIGQELLNVPFSEMIKSMGTGIAQAQFDLDMVGARMAQMMAGLPLDDEGQSVTIDFGDEKDLCLLELGFTPSFYQYTEAVIEVKMTLNYTSETVDKTQSYKMDMAGGYSQNAPWQQYLGAETASARLNTSLVNATNMAKYNIKGEGTSSLRTTLVPVPPPEVLDERIRAVVERRKAARGGR